MEFFFNLIKILAGIYLLLILIAIIVLFFRKFRKVGAWVLGFLLVVPLAAYLYFYLPISYDRSYLSQSEALKDISLRQMADVRGFYLGAIGKVADISKPEFRRTFNSLTLESALKMGPLFKDGNIGIYDFSHADSIVNFALASNLRVRGHVLVWGKLSDFFKNPDLNIYLEAFPEAERAAVLQKLVDNHIVTVLTHYKGRIFNWDVVNEPLEIFGKGELEKNVYYKYLGPDYIADAFRLAHEVDPGVKLFLNEQLMNYEDARAEAYFQLVKKLKDDGVPIHGVGIQSHVMMNLPSLDNLEKYMRRFSNLGLDVELTEVDARLRLFDDAEDPYVAQGEFYGQMLEICLGNPMCKGLTFWGYTDAHSWMDSPGFNWTAKPNEPYLYDKDMYPKPGIGALYAAFQ